MSSWGCILGYRILLIVSAETTDMIRRLARGDCVPPAVNDW